MATVTKAELAGILARDLGMPKMQALKAVDALFNGLREALLQGGRIEVRDFGSWTVKATNTKLNARNPRTGAVVVVPARRKVRFKPGRILKEALSQPS
ncbi:MAG: integration host factor subunit beta [Candidatus Latescibacteria bacterium]|nr:integration host factor subunit beta [Candidatus Latescibacterota bacterium]